MTSTEATTRDGAVLGCIFCRGTDGGFNSPEHPVPESLGNRTTVLPPGVVCDGCNHGTLSDLDKALCEFKLVSLRRSMVPVPSKSGRVPRTSMGNGTVEFRDGAVVMTMHDPRSVTEQYDDDGNLSGLHVEWQANPPVTPRLASTLARSLLKMGLGLAWLRLGEDILDPRLDHVRSIVLGGPHVGYLGVRGGGDGPPPDHVTVTYTVDAEDGSIQVLANLYGIEMLTHSNRVEPTAEVADVASVIPFDVPGI